MISNYQIFYTSIFQHKLKPHISQYDIETNSNQHLYFYENKKSILKNPFKKWGGKRLRLRAEGPPPFLERYFLEKRFFFRKSIHFVLFWLQCHVAKCVVLSCVEIYSCKISVVVRNQLIPEHHLQII